MEEYNSATKYKRCVVIGVKKKSKKNRFEIYGVFTKFELAFFK